MAPVCEQAGVSSRHHAVSELRRPRPHQAALKWIEAAAADPLFLSAATIGERQAGIEITREQDAAKADALAVWLDQVAASDGVLPMDAAAFRTGAPLKHRQSDTLLEDAMIAATVIGHNNQRGQNRLLSSKWVGVD